MNNSGSDRDHALRQRRHAAIATVTAASQSPMPVSNLHEIVEEHEHISDAPHAVLTHDPHRPRTAHKGLAPLKSVLGKHGRDNETSLEKDGAARTLGLRTDLDAPKQSIVEEEDRPSSGSLMDSLPQMMYGFGDEKEPLPETVACMQELVSEYIRHVTDEACRAASMKGRLDTECFMFAVRRDRAKYKRGREILELNEHIKGCTRMRLTSQNMDAFTPTFRPQPRVRAVAKLSNLSALQDDETEEPLLTSSSSETSGSCLSSDSEGEAGK